MQAKRTTDALNNCWSFSDGSANPPTEVCLPVTVTTAEQALAWWTTHAAELAPDYISTDALWGQLRARRDVLLNASDFTQLADMPDGDSKAAWAIYRQALRDLPAHATDPARPDWPVAPGDGLFKKAPQ